MKKKKKREWEFFPAPSDHVFRRKKERKKQPLRNRNINFFSLFHFGGEGGGIKKWVNFYRLSERHAVPPLCRAWTLHESRHEAWAAQPFQSSPVKHYECVNGRCASSPSSFSFPFIREGVDGAGAGRAEGCGGGGVPSLKCPAVKKKKKKK